MPKYTENYTDEVQKKLGIYELIYGCSGVMNSCITDEDGNQVGGYLPVFSEYGFNQDGTGIFGNIWSFMKPWFMKGTKAVANTALNTASGYLNDLIEGANWKEAGKERLKEASNDLSSKFVNNVVNMKGRGVKRLSIEDVSESPAAKVRKLIEEIERKEDKKQDPQRKLFSILPPPEKKGRDLRIKKRLTKTKRAKKGRIAKKKQKKQKRQTGKGFECWL
jgi:uncharacterized protein (UPF0335 family)